MDTERVVATNRRARYDYDVLETYEVGLVLAGAEVKSLRAGKVSLGDAYAAPQEGEIFLFNLHIPPYEKNTLTPLAPRRPRKLLVNRRELHRIARAVDQKGVTLIPLKLYFNRGYAKIQLALARGKKKYDKRERILEKDERRLAEK